VEEFGEKAESGDVPGFMLEENQAVDGLPQHGLGFVQGMRVVEFSREKAAIPGQNLTDLEEVFFAFSDQQHAQGLRRKLEFCGSWGCRHVSFIG
jgi:hypothetical protein